MSGGAAQQGDGARHGASVFHDADAIARRLPHAAAVDALEAALRDGLDPEADPPRSFVAAAGGELLVMPSAAGGGLGVKLVTVGGEPRVQGVYVLFDGDTLAPAALLDGIGLTDLRTSAVSALAVRHLAARPPRRLAVFGSGPQARAHVHALRATAPVEHVAIVGRDRGRAEALARELGAEPAGPEAIEGADVVCCCTTAREPLFDGGAVGDEAVVVAIGSHEPEAREVDEQLATRASVVVEARSAALREAGDVIQAIEAGALAEDSLMTLAELANGRANLPDEAPRLFKSTGMSWEDVVVATALARRAGAL
jgi:ornithine cyclodeaminase/alanine dehydrogenase-like protein (mu-crystallin family)